LEQIMQIIPQKIAPCLWFDTQAEEAATFYVSVFKNSKIIKVARYPNEGQDVHGEEAASVMAVDFEITGQKFAALNGGPQFTFDEAVSFQIYCENQTEVDYFWNRLRAKPSDRLGVWPQFPLRKGAQHASSALSQF